MEIKIENAKAAFEMADENIKEEVQQTPITERVKTFEDACRELGEYNHLVKQYRAIEENADFTSVGHDIFAYLKLRIIAAALNEGWEPQLTEDEQRWYPWFTLLTEEELPEESDKWKAGEQVISIDDYSEDWAGFCCAYSDAAPSNSCTYFGCRICFKSETLATYCGKQFIKLWADFNLIKKS